MNPVNDLDHLENYEGLPVKATYLSGGKKRVEVGILKNFGVAPEGCFLVVGDQRLYYGQPDAGIKEVRLSGEMQDRVPIFYDPHMIMPE